MTPTPKARLIVAWISGYVTLLLGLAAMLLGIVVFDGLLGGLFTGASVVLLLISVVTLSVTIGASIASQRASGSGARNWWLPSRDRNR